MSRKILRGISILCFLPVLTACVGAHSASPSPTGTVLSILSQPHDLSLPMGVAGTFNVRAIGKNPEYQWSRSGTAIAGANASSYTTPLAAFADSGTPFSVVVHNELGSLTSVPAILTVTARAPKIGDLRFQQVDAPSTVAGYGTFVGGIGPVVFCPSSNMGGNGQTFTSATGSAFFLSASLCPFKFLTFSLPAGVTGLDSGYGAYDLSLYPGLLNGGLYMPPNAPGDPGSVITSLNLLPAVHTVSFAFIHSETVSGFDRVQYTVPVSALQTAVTNEGLRGRVVTATSYDGNQATFLSYGWNSDTASIYEAKVVFATLDTAASVLTELASEGYLLTSSGSTFAQDGSGIVFIGTRLQGDRMSRPLLIEADYTKLLTQGYAVVAVLEKFLPSGTFVDRYYIGQR